MKFIDQKQIKDLVSGNYELTLDIGNTIPIGGLIMEDRPSINNSDIVAGVAEFIVNLKKYKPGDQITVVDRRQKMILAKIQILPCPEHIIITTKQTIGYRKAI